MGYFTDYCLLPYPFEITITVGNWGGLRYNSFLHHKDKETH